MLYKYFFTTQVTTKMLVTGATQEIFNVVFYKADRHAADHNYNYNSAWGERERMRLKEVESASL